MKKLLKRLILHWQAIVCFVFLAGVFYYAGDGWTDAFFAFALPLGIGVLYLATFLLNSDDDEDGTGTNDLMTRIGAFWMKLTMPRQKPRSISKRKE